jgi:hypothetical protein
VVLVEETGEEVFFLLEIDPKKNSAKPVSVHFVGGSVLIWKKGRKKE